MKLPYLLILGMFCCLSSAWSQTAGSSSPPGTANSVPDAQVEAPKTPPLNPAQPDKKPKTYFEVGGFYSHYTPNGESWKGLDARLIYSGFKKFTPFGGVSTQGTSLDGQQNFGAGSYITFSKRFYAITGFSVASNAATTYYPRYRFDVAGMYSLAKVSGLVLSTGFTQVGGYNPGDVGRIYSLGTIYYHRSNVFTASINVNESLPGGQWVLSGSAGIMHGKQGKYWLTAGISGGNVAYSLIQNVPFDVRYDLIGNYISYQRWLTKRFGFIIRYDYQWAIDNFGRHTIRPALFFEI